MNKNRIIITSPSLDTSKNVGGISTVTDFLIKNNVKCEYIHFELGKFDNENRGIKWFYRIIKAWFKWIQIIIKEKDLIVHFNFALDKRSIIRDSPLILFAKILKRKLVIHLHGGEYLESENIPGWIKRVIIFILSGKTPKIVLSPLEKELVVSKFNCSNIEALPNCIDLIEAKNFNRVNPINSHLKLLFLGRIVLRKGIEDIFQALKKLKDKNIPFSFIMAGAGPDKDTYVKKFSELLLTNFEFRGIVAGENKTELLKECNVFLLPSLSGEGLPISLLESMSFSLVPIVTDNGSMAFVVKNGENGIIVNQESSSEIASAIENLSTREGLLQKLGKNACQSVFDNFDPDDYIAKLNEIYSRA
jgi:glycosyltransferase involved in cell wall biosynthesis